MGVVAPRFPVEGRFARCGRKMSMRIPALAVLAFVASGCTIHVVEAPATPIAQQPAPALVAPAGPAPVVVATRAPAPAVGPAPVWAPAAATPVRTRPRPELLAHVQPQAQPGRLRFKDTAPEPRTTEVASVDPPSMNPTRIEKHRRYDQNHVRSTDVAQTQ